LTIIIHSNFSAEKKYIIRVLMSVYLGLEYSLEMSEQHEYKIILKNAPPPAPSKGGDERGVSSKEGNESGVFLKGGDERAVSFKQKETSETFSEKANTNAKNASVSPSGGAWGVDCGIDIFAGAFFMLSRWEELVNPARDVHERFPAKASLAFRCDFLHRAVVNEYVELLWNMLRHLGIEQERKSRNFSFVLTHDVDMPRLWHSAFSPIKTIVGDIFKRKNKAAAQQHFHYWKKKKDPFDTFDELMYLSEYQGLMSHFFFIAGGNTRFEGNYEVDNFSIKKLITRIHERGHVVGIHPSYDTYRHAAMLSSEIEALQQVSPQSVKAGRQHFLRFGVPHTWQVWEDNGLEWDSTLGYADKVGFRCGTCYSFPVFNVLTRRELNLVERPLLVMEVSLFSEAYMGLTQAEALVSVREIVETVRQFEGEFVLLWHNSNLVLNGEDYWEMFKAVLRM